MSCHHSGNCRCPKFLPSTATAPTAPPVTYTFPAVFPPDMLGYNPNGYSVPVPIAFVPTASQAEVDALKLRVAALETRLAAKEQA